MSSGTQTRITPTRVEIRGLSKSFGPVRAVSDLNFTVEPGTVTGFLGPNGSGKTTTLRMLLGLLHPDAGTATIGGTPYAELAEPVRTVGAVLETSFHPARSGRNHLRVYCRAAGLPVTRADEVLAQVGLTEAADRRAGGYSLGMRQRLALAAALLGDPAVLVLDEPANGLDPEGIQWLRGFLRHLAEQQGRTVLVSSHLLSEMEQTADRVVIVGAGRLVREGTLADLRAGADDHDPVGGLLHLRQQVARHQDGAALYRGQVPQEATQPLDPLGVEPVGRLVEHEDGGVPEQRRGEGKALPHAQ